MVTVSICFAPQAMARPRVGSPKRLSQGKKLHRKHNIDRNQVKIQTSSKELSSSGVEATTYSRLPHKEDFASLGVDSASFSSLESQSPFEVKLSDSDVVNKEEESDCLNEEDENDEAGGSMDDVFAFDYFKGELRANEEEYEISDEADEEGVDYGDENGDVEYLKSRDGEVVSFSDEEEDVKEKGVPAVMRCFDRAKIYAKAGDGGNGVVAFRREKFVPLGGPSGGDGGRGGNVYVEVEGSMNSLLPFRNSVHYRAGRGGHGQGRMQNGAKGEDVVIKVAPGTIIRKAGSDEVLLELLYPEQRALLLPGGRGGRGNVSFKSGSNKVPKIAENGEEGPEMWLDLELKLVADVGIVGAPNAGKSTLLSVISAAQPAIANYPFTTLLPNLGVVSFDYDSTIVVADLPGLLEGAHRGFGLGHEFLRHTERCSSLVHVIDGSGPQPEYEFEAVRLELELFSPELAEKPYVVAYNKMDLPEAYENWPSFKEKLQVRGIEPFCISAVKSEGTHDVICAAFELLQKNKEIKGFEGVRLPENMNHVADMVRKQRSASINDFEITYESSSRSWHVVGSGLERFVQMTNWRYMDSEKRFQHVLEACGVNKSLLKFGVKEGDTVHVAGMEMVWNDSPDSFGPSKVKKGPADSIKWADWKEKPEICRIHKYHWYKLTLSEKAMIKLDGNHSTNIENQWPSGHSVLM